MLQSTICATLGLLLHIALVASQDNRSPDPNNHFIYPPLPGPQFSNDPEVFWTNPNFTVGVLQKQPFKWVSNMATMQVTLQQEGNPAEVQFHTIQSRSHPSPKKAPRGDAAFALFFSHSSPLAAWNCSDPDATPVFLSHYINLTLPAGGSPASSSSVTATVTASQSSTASSSPSIDASSPSNRSFYNTALIGGSIAGGIGGAFVLVGAGFVLSRCRKAKRVNRQRQVKPTSYGMEPQARPFHSGNNPFHGSVVYSSEVNPAELSSDAKAKAKPSAELVHQSTEHLHTGTAS